MDGVIRSINSVVVGEVLIDCRVSCAWSWFLHISEMKKCTCHSKKSDLLCAQDFLRFFLKISFMLVCLLTFNSSWDTQGNYYFFQKLCMFVRLELAHERWQIYKFSLSFRWPHSLRADPPWKWRPRRVSLGPHHQEGVLAAHRQQPHQPGDGQVRVQHVCAER